MRKHLVTIGSSSIAMLIAVAAVNHDRIHLFGGEPLAAAATPAAPATAAVVSAPGATAAPQTAAGPAMVSKLPLVRSAGFAATPGATDSDMPAWDGAGGAGDDVMGSFRRALFVASDGVQDGGFSADFDLAGQSGDRVAPILASARRLLDGEGASGGGIAGGGSAGGSSASGGGGIPLIAPSTAVSTVPEPSTWMGLITGMTLVGMMLRGKRRVRWVAA